jgi:hypothetical protein
MLGPNYIECIVEMSRYNNKFFILAYDMFTDKYHCVEMHQHQATKLLKACDETFENVMKLLDFHLGKMFIKHFDMLM